jgi:hypothetical protein
MILSGRGHSPKREKLMLQEKTSVKRDGRIVIVLQDQRPGCIRFHVHPGHDLFTNKEFIFLTNRK